MIWLAAVCATCLAKLTCVSSHVEIVVVGEAPTSIQGVHLIERRMVRRCDKWEVRWR